jgi:hypothetical protein
LNEGKISQGIFGMFFSDWLAFKGQGRPFKPSGEVPVLYSRVSSMSKRTVISKTQETMFTIKYHNKKLFKILKPSPHTVHKVPTVVI